MAPGRAQRLLCGLRLAPVGLGGESAFVALPIKKIELIEMSPSGNVGAHSFWRLVAIRVQAGNTFGLQAFGLNDFGHFVQLLASVPPAA
jgi:hypothetical protein